MWIHYWNPKIKKESIQWIYRSLPTPKKFQTEQSAGKIMAIVLWDLEEILLMY
jgi:hypothetical protein